MLSDLVDEDLLSGSLPLSTSTKTMVNMTNMGKFLRFLYVEWTHRIGDDNYIWNLTHVRCVCEKQQHSHIHSKITIIWMHARSLSIDVCLLNTLTPGLSSSLEQSYSCLL